MQLIIPTSHRDTWKPRFTTAITLIITLPVLQKPPRPPHDVISHFNFPEERCGPTRGEPRTRATPEDRSTHPPRPLLSLAFASHSYFPEPQRRLVEFSWVFLWRSWCRGLAKLSLGSSNWYFTSIHNGNDSGSYEWILCLWYSRLVTHSLNS